MKPRIAFYSPANLNLIDGSAIWVQAVAATLVSREDVDVTVLQRMPERRDVVTGLLRRVPGVKLVPPSEVGSTRESGLIHTEALDALERLDREPPFDVVLLRSFDLCRLAAERPQLRDRIWAAYIVEPERNLDDPEHRAALERIASSVRHVVCQSEEMRAVYEALIPAARGRTILLPPAIPDEPDLRADPKTVVPRLIYTGKFHPFYPVDRAIGWFREYRASRPELTFHVVGDKIASPPSDPGYRERLEGLLTATEGVVWHGGMDRSAVARLLAEGGLGLSLWDYAHGSRLNDLVVSTKLLDYAAVGLPVVLNRTAAQETLLGPDYPLFVNRADDAREVIAEVLADAGLWADAAERTWAASRPFTYPAVRASLDAWLPGLDAPRRDPALAQLDRPKLAGAEFAIGLGEGVSPDPALVAQLRERDPRYRLVVGAERPPDAAAPPEGISWEPPATGLAAWLRRIGFLVIATGPGADVEARAAEASGALAIHLGPDAGEVAERIHSLVSGGGWAAEGDAARRLAGSR